MSKMETVPTRQPGDSSNAAASTAFVTAAIAAGGGGGGGGTSIFVSDTPPVGAPVSSLWWQSNTGNLYINFQDVDSTQWVLAVPGSSITTITNGSTVIVGGTPGRLLANNGGLLGEIDPSPLIASLAADVALNNTANYFDGPSIGQGSVGTWYVSGSVLVNDSALANIYAKLWDGTTVIASGAVVVAAGYYAMISLSGYITNPAANLRISCRDQTNTTGLIRFSATGNGKDSTITAHRIK